MPYEQELTLLVNQMLDGYALHEIVRDGNGKAIDYRFIDVNPAFSQIIGLRPENTLGRTLREVLPELGGYWLERYGQVADTGNPTRFATYAAPLGKYLEVAAYRPRAGVLAATFRDATREIRAAMESALEQSIIMMGRLCEVRDPYTANHQRRVAVLAQRIAQGMGLPPDQVKAIYLGALVHDIGKVAIPVEILNFPGRLSEHQYSFVKIHPQAGYDIVKQADLPWSVADIVLQHQERLDGSGYPNGLTADEIRLETRIVMVADVFEAITCHRPYRGFHSQDAAIAEMRQNDGRLYDHDVVTTCLGLLDVGELFLQMDC